MRKVIYKNFELDGPRLFIQVSNYPAINEVVHRTTTYPPGRIGTGQWVIRYKQRTQ